MLEPSEVFLIALSGWGGWAVEAGWPDRARGLRAAAVAVLLTAALVLVSAPPSIGLLVLLGVLS